MRVKFYLDKRKRSTGNARGQEKKPKEPDYRAVIRFHQLDLYRYVLIFQAFFFLLRFFSPG